MDTPTVKFECTRCGECCTNLNADNVVFVFPEDAEAMSAHLNLSVPLFYETYCYEESIDIGAGSVRIHAIKSKEGNCPFLKENLCGVHAAKPIQCKTGPFGFFWDGRIRFKCMETAVIPADWDTTENDLKLIKNLKIY